MDKVFIKEFDKTYLGHINAWQMNRDYCPHSDLQDLPVIGYMALVDVYPMAAGFLRKVEGRMGLLDGFILNPSYPRSLKNEILDGITLKLIMAARELKMTGLIGLSLSSGILERAKKHGFKLRTEQMISLSLKEELLCRS
jgi:hypothetical protein